MGLITKGIKMDKKNMAVLTNIIGAVESGGQIYGKRNYAAYVEPYTNSDKEHTITIGWAQNYGKNAQELIHRIYAKDPASLSGDLVKALSRDWVRERFAPSPELRNDIINAITCYSGREAQDELFAELMESYLKDCPTDDIKAQMMYCEIRHLGGKKAADRIFKRAASFSLDDIMVSLVQDQSDKSSNNQVGDLKFQKRHEKCVEFIKKYAVVDEDEESAAPSDPVEIATSWMEGIAADDSHGYDQIYRWGEKGDYDCSALVISAWEEAGVHVKEAGATYTGNMLSSFKRCGFKDVTKSVDLKTGAGLLRGDVLLKSGKHVAVYVGDGKEVEASINEKGSAKGGKPGDQTGKEILVRAYRNYPWSNILRYGATEDAPAALKSNNEIAMEVIAGKWGNGEERKKRLTDAGYDPKAIQGIVNSLTSTKVRMRTTANLRLRADAGTDKRILAVMSKGTLVTWDGTFKTIGGTRWLYIDTPAGKGYASGSYLDRV